MKKELAASFGDGPYIQVAALCDSTIEDKSNALSLIRIVDTIIHFAQPTDGEIPTVMPAIKHPLKLVIMIKCKISANYDIKVTPVSPSGETMAPISCQLYIEGEEKGANLIMDMQNFVYEHEGLYWFDVHINEVPLTRVPLRVKYQMSAPQFLQS